MRIETVDLIEFHNNLWHSMQKRATADRCLFVEHRFGSMNFFLTNIKFVNSIFHLFPNLDRFSKNILIFKDWTIIF